MILLDANIFLRYLTADDPLKADACRRLFEKLNSGGLEATTTEAILHEILYVLTSRSHYHLTHEAAAERVRPLLLVRGLRIPNKRRYLRALDIYSGSNYLDFPDAICVAMAESGAVESIASYGTDFDRWPDIRRIEP